MKVERIGLYAVQFAVCSLLRLSLVKVTLSTCFAIELLDFVSVNVEEITVIGFLDRGCKTTKNDHMFLRYLEQTTPFEANPVGILLDFEV